MYCRLLASNVHFGYKGAYFSWGSACLKHLEIVLSHHFMIGHNAAGLREEWYEWKYNVAPTYRTQNVNSTFCLRPSMKISAGQTGQSYVELDGSLKISLATGQHLNRPLLILCIVDTFDCIIKNYVHQNSVWSIIFSKYTRTVSTMTKIKSIWTIDVKPNYGWQSAIFHSNGLAIWHSLSGIRHIKVNYGRQSAILNLIKLKFFRAYPWNRTFCFIVMV